MSFFIRKFSKKNLPTVVPHPSPARLLRSLALAPLLKNPGYASDHIVYVSLYISRYPSVRNTHFPWICIFFLLFLFKIFPKIHPKCAPDRSISISKMQKLPRVGGGTPPPTPSPHSGASRPRLRFPSIVDNLAPPTKKFLRTALVPVTPSVHFAKLKSPGWGTSICMHNYWVCAARETPIFAVWYTKVGSGTPIVSSLV